MNTKAKGKYKSSSPSKVKQRQMLEDIINKQVNRIIMNLSNFQYFKRKRQNVEILSSLGTGLGLTIFSKLLNELIK